MVNGSDRGIGRRERLAAITLAVVLLPSALFAQWSKYSDTNTIISYYSGHQTDPVMIADGQGGAILAWHDTRNGWSSIFAQRVNAYGRRTWDTSGVLLSAMDGDTKDHMGMISDGQGGAIVVWRERPFDYQMYAQRISGDGTVLWTAGGVTLTTETADQRFPRPVSDGESGAVVTWQRYVSGTFDLYAQRIDESGSVQWGSAGIAVCDTVGNQTNPVISKLGADAVIVWMDSRFGSSFGRLFAQRLTNAGTKSWTWQGKSVAATPGGTHEGQAIAVHEAIGDTSIMVVWQKPTSGFYDLFFQRLDQSGNRLWGLGGDTLYADSGHHQGGANLISRGDATFTVVWDDQRTTSLGEPYAQTFDTAGTLSWGAGGVQIDAHSYLATSLVLNVWPMVLDESGDVIVAFHEYDIDQPYQDVYAQKLNASGGKPWGTARGVATDTFYTRYPEIVTDRNGGAILTWDDSRNLSDMNLYIQRINSDGSLPSDTISGWVFWDSIMVDDLGYTAGVDTGLPGWSVILLDMDGLPLDTALTDTNGFYMFPNLGFGDYTLRQIPQSTHEQSFPFPQTDQTASFTAPDAHLVLDFGNSVIKPAVASGDWNSGANWTGGTTPDQFDVAVIPSGIDLTITDLTEDTVLAVVIRSGGSLTFAASSDILKITGFFIVEAGGTLTFPADAASSFVCFGTFINDGTLNSGQSTFYFVGDRAKYISVDGVGGEAAPAAIPARFREFLAPSGVQATGGFYNLVILGDSTASLSNIPVGNTLELYSDFGLRPQDTLDLANDDPVSLTGDGIVAEGTIRRAIDPATLLAYRFESEATSVEFSAAGTRPSALSMTAYPDSAAPADTSLCADTIASTIDTTANVVTAANVGKFSRWAFSRVRRVTGGPPPPVRRYYAVTPAGGVGFNATVSFRYEQAEVPGTIPEEDVGVVRLEPCSGPEFFVSASIVSFDTIAVGQNTADSVYVVNTGDSPLTLLSITSGNPEFAVSPAGGSVPAGDSLKLQITFTPALGGSRTGTITLSHNAPGSPHGISVSGTGGAPNFAVSTPALSFGDVRLADDSVMNVTVSNTGTMPLTVSAAVAGDAQFSILPPGALIPPSGNQAFAVTFAASSAGPVSGAALFMHDAPGTPDTVLLSATGVTPLFAVAPPSVEFGDVIAGLSVVDTVFVVNAGTASLTVTGIISTNALFTAAPSAASVPAGDSIDVVVTFSPVAAGAATGHLIFTHDAAGSPDSVSVGGTGVVSNFAVAPVSLNFDTVVPGTGKLDSVVVSNAGAAPLVITSAAGSPAQFAVIPAAATVPPSGSQKFYVTFTPAATGPVGGTVTFTHNAAGSPSSVPVSGVGGVGAFSVEPPLLAFFGVVVGSSKADSVAVVNTGSGTLVIAAASTDSPEFPVVPSGASIGIGDTARFSVIFAPASAGSRSARLVFTHNGVTSPDTVEINGLAVDPEPPSPSTTAWYLLSVPVAIPPTHVADLFPSATTSGYAYVSGGYFAADTLVNGVGYWVKIDGPDTAALSGSPILADTFDVTAGWNLIGCVGVPVGASAIGSIPAGMSTSRFYQYHGSYTAADTLLPRQAYWVKAGSDGALVIASGSAVAPSARIRIVPGTELPPPPPAPDDGSVGPVPTEFRLDQNYPNPFNPVTTIGYSVATSGRVTIRIYDLLGRVIGTLLDEVREPGRYSIEWDAERHSSGVYICRMNSGGFEGTRTLLLLK